MCGEKLLCHLCLDSGDCDDAHDILCGAAAGQIVHRLCDALEDRAIGLGASEALDKLVADVAGLEIREDEDIGMSCNLGARCLELSHGRDEGSVELQVAVEGKLGVLLLGKLRCLLDLRRDVALCGALRGEGEHSDLRVGAHVLLPGLGRGKSDLGELFCGRCDVEAAVSEEQRAFVAVLGLVRAHDEEGRDKLGARSGLQDLECRTKGVGRGVAGAGHEAVSVSCLDHHRAEVGGVVHLLPGVFDGDALLLAELGKELGVGFMLLCSLGVDDLDTLDRDLGRVAEDNELGEALLHDLLCSLDGARIFALGQDDRLEVRLGLLLHAV